MAFDSRLLSGIQVLVAVVEAGSFARATASLGITQSGVSRAVARLEQRVGIRLFDPHCACGRPHRRGTQLLSASEAAVDQHRGCRH